MEASLFVATSVLLLLTFQVESRNSNSLPSDSKTDFSDVLIGLYKIHRRDPFTLDDVKRIFNTDLGSNSTSNSTVCNKKGLLDEFGWLTLDSVNITAATLDLLNQYLNGLVVCVADDNIYDFVKCVFQYMYDDILSTFTFINAFVLYCSQAWPEIKRIVSLIKQCT